ncbi:uncharacterized protein CC84DRAFT_1076669, partial [Paraphaeosphaeria sporulosa]
NDIDAWATDISQLFEHLDVTDATVVGHSTSGGDLTCFAAKLKAHSGYGPYGSKKLSWVLGEEASVDQHDDTAVFSYDVPEGPLFGFNRPNAIVSKGFIPTCYNQSRDNQSMQASFKSTFDTIASWETDFRPDLQSLDMPILVIHGVADQIIPI